MAYLDIFILRNVKFKIDTTYFNSIRNILSSKTCFLKYLCTLFHTILSWCFQPYPIENRFQTLPMTLTEDCVCVCVHTYTHTYTRITEI